MINGYDGVQTYGTGKVEDTSFGIFVIVLLSWPLAYTCWSLDGITGNTRHLRSEDPYLKHFKCPITDALLDCSSSLHRVLDTLSYRFLPVFGTVDTGKGWHSQVCPRAIGGIGTCHKMRQ